MRTLVLSSLVLVFAGVARMLARNALATGHPQAALIVIATAGVLCLGLSAYIAFAGAFTGEMELWEKAVAFVLQGIAAACFIHSLPWVNPSTTFRAISLFAGLGIGCFGFLPMFARR